MRVTVEHREGQPGLLGNQRPYYLECTIAFSEEEKAVIGRRGLGDHYITMPKGYVAVFDPTENKRIRALRLAVAGSVAFVSFWAMPLSGGHAIPAFAFVGSFIYAIYCLYRYVRPKTLQHEKLTLDSLAQHKMFILETPNPVRSKEVEEQLLASVERMKSFLEGSIEIGDRTVREF